MARNLEDFWICEEEKDRLEHISYQGPMPRMVQEGEDENECDNNDLVFLSPEEDFPSKNLPIKDQGASPVLRRSNHKRKSTASVSDMTKGSSSKKKKNSPTRQEQVNKSPAMPKVPRSPVTGGQAAGAAAAPKPAQQGQSFEALLLAMEERLTAKLERASEASREAANQAKLNSESLELLESRVDPNENCLMEALSQSEARIMAKVQAQVQDLVQEKARKKSERTSSGKRGDRYGFGRSRTVPKNPWKPT